MTREEVKACIEEIGIFPGIRVSSPDQALYAAKTIYDAGIPVAEITMTVPGAVNVIGELAQRYPDMVVGAGTVLDKETAERCLDAGARFLTSTGLVPEVIGSAHKRGVVVIPGALTPTEVISAWKAGADYVKIYPAASELLPREAIRRHQEHRIHELARRFLGFVKEARTIS
jgi:2-dehydro-3-deoxyphosphogluconate aldolase/(4S)-4-hydroxy-2-oxoglutarate aldolase